MSPHGFAGRIEQRHVAGNRVGDDANSIVLEDRNAVIHVALHGVRPEFFAVLAVESVHRLVAAPSRHDHVEHAVLVEIDEGGFGLHVAGDLGGPFHF